MAPKMLFKFCIAQVQRDQAEKLSISKPAYHRITQAEQTYYEYIMHLRKEMQGLLPRHVKI